MKLGITLHKWRISKIPFSVHTIGLNIELSVIFFFQTFHILQSIRLQLSLHELDFGFQRKFFLSMVLLNAQVLFLAFIELFAVILKYERLFL